MGHLLRGDDMILSISVTSLRTIICGFETVRLLAIRKRHSETFVEVHLMSSKQFANNIMIQDDGNRQEEIHLIFH